jgi:phosphoserine phosphatase RsbU/P
MCSTVNTFTALAATADSVATILVADDDRMARRMLKLLLGSGGYNLVFAESGQEALSQARALRPDLVLLDVDMPDIHGYEVCRQLRNDPVLAEVPVMMVTALTDREARIRGIEAGADDFISKPFDHVELAARVRTITRLNRYRRVQEGQRLAHQIEMAATVQQLLLPRQAPDLPELEIVSRYRPAGQVGGDYYDLVMRGRQLYFVVADVSGHGLASALFMASARSALRALIPWTRDVLQLADAINHRIVEDAGDSGMFLTGVIGCYDPDDDSVMIVNCGHPEPILRRANGDSETVPATAAPFGLMDQLGAEAVRMFLSPGDVLTLCTDSVIEAARPSGELFGYARLQDVLAGRATGTLETMADAVLDSLRRFTGSAALEDDLTLLLLKRRVSHA